MFFCFSTGSFSVAHMFLYLQFFSYRSYTLLSFHTLNSILYNNQGRSINKQAGNPFEIIKKEDNKHFERGFGGVACLGFCFLHLLRTFIKQTDLLNKTLGGGSRGITVLLKHSQRGQRNSPFSTS